MTDYSKTIIKALKVLECFIGKNEYKRLDQIKNDIGLEKSSTCRFLKTLEKYDFIEQDKNNKKYRLGKKVLLLGLSIINSLDIRKEALPFMQELNKTFGETVNLGINYNNKLLYLEILKGKGYVHEAAFVGGQDPLYSTSMGKAIIASFNDNELEDYFNNTVLVKKTPNTITDTETLKKVINDVRNNGYAADDEENEIGLIANGVSIKNHEAKAIAAISISFLNISVDSNSRKKIIDSLLKASEELSKRFGYYSKF